MTTATKPLSYSIAGACAATGLSRSQLLRAIHSGELKAKKSNRVKGGDNAGEPIGKFVIRAVDLDAYLEDLPDA